MLHFFKAAHASKRTTGNDKIGRQITFALLFLLGLSAIASTQVPNWFRNSYIGLDDFKKIEKSCTSFDNLLNSGNFDKAEKSAATILKTYPDIGRGYIMRYQLGVTKKDLSLIRESLTELPDKYFFYLYNYKVVASAVDTVKEEELKKEIQKAVDIFFIQREAFLIKTLEHGINALSFLKELAVLNYEAGDEIDFVKWVEQIMPYDFDFALRFSDKPGWTGNDLLKKARNSFRKKLAEWEGTLEQKMAAYLRVVSEIKLKNASLDFSHIKDWYSHAAEYLPRLVAAETKLEFYETLADMVTRIGEDHTLFLFSEDILDSFSNCGLKTTFTDDKFLVEEILNERLETKIRPGDEIVSVAGMPVMDYIEFNRSHYPFVSYFHLEQESRSHYRIGKRLLMGKKDSRVEVEIKRFTDGIVFKVELERDAYKLGKKSGQDDDLQKLIRMEALDDDIYYFNILRFYGTDVYKEFQDLIRGIDTEKAKGVIFDLRENPGGNSGYGDSIFSHFIEETKNNYIFQYYPVRIPLNDVQGFGVISAYRGGWPIWPAKDKKFSCPVVLLISSRTGSAAEDFSFLWKYHKRGTFVGTPTAGGTGNGYNLFLPGGGRVRICLNVDLYYSWKGIRPDFPVQFTARDIAEGRDPQLEKALEVITR